MKVQVFREIGELPPHFLQMLQQAGESCYFHSLPWHENLLGNSFPKDTGLLVYGVETEETPPQALCVFFAHAIRGRLGPSLSELSNFYSLNAGPVLAPGIDPAPVIDGLVGHIAAEGWISADFGPIDKDSPLFDALCASLASHAFAVEPYFKHGNLYQDTAGQSFEQYLKSLGKNAREAQRKSRKLDREHDTEWRLITDLADLPRGLEHYNRVYDLSWKEPEIFPDFIPRLMEHTASIGALRLANLTVDGEPAATQLIVLSGRHAVMLKTAYAPKFERYSIGTVVLVRLLEQIMGAGDVDRVDLGAGDEPYKKHWATQRQERWGVMAYNLRTVPGLAKAAALQGRRAVKSLRDVLAR
mgnify:CR=1 FL=1